MNKQELATRLAVRGGKDDVLAIVAEIGDDPQGAADLYAVFVEGDDRTRFMASWTLDHLVSQQPQLIEPHLDDIAERLPLYTTDTEKRLMMKILSVSPLPMRHLGLMMEYAYDWLVNPQVAVAIRVHAMELLYRISNEEPELKRELILAIQAHLHDGTAGFKSRGKKTLKKLSRETGIYVDPNDL